MQKLTPLLAGELGETLALAKLISLGMHAYVSPPGAPGHDIMVTTPEGSKSVEIKTRQYIDRASEIGRWPVNLKTKGTADYFTFVELHLRSLKPTFYLLDNEQAKANHRDYEAGGNCLPSAVRAAVRPNDFSALTGEPDPATEDETPAEAVPAKVTAPRREIAQDIAYKQMRLVRYSCQSIDVFLNGELQSNTIEQLRHVAKELGISEFNEKGGLRNTRQLGRTVIEAVEKRKSASL